MKREALIATLLAITAAIALVSATIGREILAGQNPSLFWFAVVNFAGYLFFIVMPVEVLVPVYIAFGHSKILVLVTAVVTALIAQLIDYVFGYLISSEIITRLIGEKKYKKSYDAMKKYGCWAIFLFNLFPLSSPIIVLIAGILRFPVRDVVLYSAAGLILKYVFLVYGSGLIF